MKLHIIDAHYFASSYRQDNWLQSKIIRDILVPYLTHMKGGYNARYGTVNRRGGSRTTAIAPRYRQEALAQGDDTRIQNSGGMARQAIRPGCVYRIAEVQIREETLTIEELASLSAAVTRHSSEAQPTDESLARNRCLFCSIAYLVWQRKQAE